MSHNRFSTLTRQTFPSNIYVPYDLQKVDLSYNIMSYLPVDLKYGTGRLKFLNLSHNQINGLNQHVLANLTKLEVLDLSHNDLNDEKRSFRFRVSENLTELHLNNNNLHYLPVDKLGAGLRRLHLEENSFETIDEQILAKIMNEGLETDFRENPIHCDCGLQPLRQFIEQLPKAPEFMKSIICNSPSTIEGQLLIDVDEAILICPYVATGETVEKGLAINPDVKYRKVFL